MADYGPSEEQRPDNFHRGRGYQQNRPPFRGRGRGRGRGDNRFYNVQRTLNDLQVSDLREHLDRKHLHEQTRGGPPSEPSYSYLRDPFTDDYSQPPKGPNVQCSNSYLRDPIRNDHSQSPKGPNVQRSNSYSSRRGRGRPQYQEETFIQNPLNIKVQLSTSTGHRNCSIDEDTTLLNIRHIPDTQFSFLHERPRGTRSVRARGTRFSTESGSYGGQVRAKSTERRHDGFYENRGSQVRSKSVEARGETSGGRGRGNYRGRGRGDHRSSEGESQIKDNEFKNKFRGRGTGRANRRGRGGHQYNTPHTELQTGSNEVVAEENREPRNRVRGRGVGRGNRRGRGSQQYNTPHTESVGDNEIASEENWDADESREVSVDKNIETELQDQQEDDQEHSEESELQDYAEEQKLEDTESSVEEEKVVIEENLVVTSSLESKNKKRTVRFKEEGRDDDRNEVKDDTKDIQQTEETKG